MKRIFRFILVAAAALVAARLAPAADIPFALLDPAGAKETAPDRFAVRFKTTKGAFKMDCRREWSPNGADRLYTLVRLGFYDGVAFFRAVEGFMVQFGIHGEPAVSAAWKEASIPDDPVTQSNTRGYVAFATAGPNTRATQLFISYGDNSRLDAMGFSPVCQVDEAGMKVVDALHTGYGEGAPRGRGPSQALLHDQGNAYLEEGFPELDYVKTARIVRSRL